MVGHDVVVLSLMSDVRGLSWLGFHNVTTIKCEPISTFKNVHKTYITSCIVLNQKEKNIYYGNVLPF